MSQALSTYGCGIKVQHQVLLLITDERKKRGKKGRQEREEAGRHKGGKRGKEEAGGGEGGRPVELEAPGLPSSSLSQGLQPRVLYIRKPHYYSLSRVLSFALGGKRG